MLSPRTAFLYGLFFSSVTLAFWGVLPIALKLSTGFTDPITLTWLRFTVACVILLAWQGMRGSLNEFRQLTLKDWLTLWVAGSFLIINYTTFTWSLDYLHPGAAQLNFQVAPFFLAIGGVVFLKERIRLIQWACFATLAIGMLLFFHPALTSHNAGSSIWIGVLIVQLSALCWALYALLQKSLFRKLAPTNILLGIYVFALVVMLPFSHPSDLLALDELSWYVVIFCCINTLIAYGAFAQAMKYWQTVQVSAMIALTPVASFTATELCVIWGLWPDYIRSASIDTLSLIGLATVVVSAITVQFITAAIQRQERRQQTTVDLPIVNTNAKVT